jgi:basic membrane lipoprotein Med (substrate-binding protein (PBP1-ABC) superfamily)
VNRHFHIPSRICLVAIASLIALSCHHHAVSDFKVALFTPGPISDAAWNAGAYEGLMRIRDSLGAQVSHVETKTRAEFDEAFRDFASRRYRLVFGHGFEFQDAAAGDSIVGGTLRVQRVEFVPDRTPVARP